MTEASESPPESSTPPPNPFASLTPVDQEHLNLLGQMAYQADVGLQQAAGQLEAAKEQKAIAMGAFDGAGALIIKQRGCEPKDFRVIYDAATGQVSIAERR